MKKSFLFLMALCIVSVVMVPGAHAAAYSVEADGDQICATDDTITFSGDFTGSVGNTTKQFGAVTTANDGTGDLLLWGGNTATSTVGAAGLSLKRIIIGNAQTTDTFNGDVYTRGLHFAADGTVALADTKSIYTTSISTATDGTGDLLFAGTSTVGGNVGTVDANLRQIAIAGALKQVSFTGNVYAHTIFFSNEGTAKFADGTTIITTSIETTTDGQGDLLFAGDATVGGDVGLAGLNLRQIKLDGDAGEIVDFTGNVYASTIFFTSDGTAKFADGKIVGTTSIGTTNDGQGNLLFAGDATIGGDVGLAGLNLNRINIDAAAGEIVDFTGNVFANTINFTSDGTVRIAHGKNVGTTGITTGITSKGNLRFAGTSTVGGEVGTASASLNRIEVVGAKGTEVSFTGNVYADTIFFTDEATVKFADGKSVTTTSIGTTIDDQGDLIFAGTSTVTGDVGQVGSNLRLIKVDGDAGKNVAFQGDVNARTIFFTSDATIAFADGKNVTTTSIGTTNDGQGNLLFAGTHTVGGDVALPGSNLKRIEIAGASGKVVSFTGDVNANNINITSDAKIIFADGKNVTTQSITPSTTNKGTLHFAGTSTVGGNVGAPGAVLKLITADGETGKRVSFTGNVYATTLNFTDVATVGMGNDTILNAAITTSNNNKGQLVFVGTSTVTGDVGATSYALKKIIVQGGANKEVTFNNDVYATNLEFRDDNTVTMAAGRKITGTVTTVTTDEGTLTYLGSTTTGGDIGVAGGAILKVVKFQGGTATVANNINATQIYVQDTVIDLNASKTFTGTQLTLSGTSTLDIGSNRLTHTGIFSMGPATTLRLSVSDARTGNIQAVSQDASINPGAKLTIDVSGYLTNGTIYTVVNGQGGTTVVVPTITDTSAMYSFTGQTSNGQLAIITSKIAMANVAGVNSTVGDMATLLDTLSASATGRMATVCDTLTGLDATALSDALDQLSPEPIGGSIDSVLSVGGAVSNVTVGHLSEARMAAGLDYERGPVGPAGPSGEAGDSGTGAWAQTFGSFGDQDPRDNKMGYEYDTYGIMIGVDGLFNDMVLGVSSGYAWTDVDTDGGNATTEVGSFNLGVYGTYGVEDFYLNTDLRYAHNSIESDRKIVFMNQTATGDTDADSWTVLMGGGYYLGSGNWILTPNLAFKYTYFDMDAYTESGAPGSNLKIYSYDTDSIQSNLGVRTGYQDDKYLVDLRANYIHEFEDKDRKIKAGFDADPSESTFVVEGMDPDRDFFMLGAGIRAFLEDGISVSLNYDLELRDEFAAQTVTGEVRIDF